MECLEVIILNTWYQESILSLRIVYSKGKEGMTSGILLFKDLNAYNFSQQPLYQCFETVLVCPCFYTNRTSLELQTLLCLLFFCLNVSLHIGEAACIRVRLIRGLLRYCIRPTSCAKCAGFELDLRTENSRSQKCF